MNTRNRTSRTRRPLCPETLEGRALLSGTGANYVLSGTQWSNPAHITYSIAPDGVDWGDGTNNLNAVFNAQFGNGTWQRQVALALATWEAVANITIVPVSESGAWPLWTTGQTQGDPRFGDIRFGGANFNDNQTLAQSFSPPPAGATETAYGNVEINTAMPWNIGSNYDLYSVMLHETGLALGLSEPPPGGADVVMNTIYGGVRTWLMPGDIAGIQAIYGARTADAYQSAGEGTSEASAVDVSAAVAGSLQATIGRVSLPAIGASEYFSVVVPSNGGSTLSVTASAAGISLLSPAISVYNSSGQLVATQSNAAAWGDAVTTQVNGLVAGQRYYIKVTGATSDAFAVGAYQLQVSFPNGIPSIPHSTQAGIASIVAVYEEVLTRAPTVQEETTWLAQLQAGASPQQLTLALYQSTEHDALVINGVFETYLNRRADPTALTVFTTWMEAGAGANDIALALIGSAEFAADYSTNSSFLSALYQDALGRTPDPTGAATFTQWLNQGAPRTQVAQAVFGSYEYQTREVRVAYAATLGRPADASGQQFFVAVLQPGQGGLNAVYVDLLLSDENMKLVGY
ncbi:MAG: DUF4214 domain-containing protein [Isosphaeraceae bacterium]|nr:DUF4214 domain-containing protein [Isosphaeraceae bacterium]